MQYSAVVHSRNKWINMIIESGPPYLMSHNFHRLLTVVLVAIACCVDRCWLIFCFFQALRQESQRYWSPRTHRRQCHASTHGRLWQKYACTSMGARTWPRGRCATAPSIRCKVNFKVELSSRGLQNWVNDLQFLTRILTFQRIYWPKARRKDAQKVWSDISVYYTIDRADKRRSCRWYTIPSLSLV